jgi:hypothetical protein
MEFSMTVTPAVRNIALAVCGAGALVGGSIAAPGIASASAVS